MMKRPVTRARGFSRGFVSYDVGRGPTQARLIFPSRGYCGSGVLPKELHMTKFGRILALPAVLGAMGSWVGCGGSDNTTMEPGALTSTGGTGVGGAGPGAGGTPPTTCTSSGNCAAPTPYCDTAGGICVECMGDANCGAFGARSACNMTTHQCVQCTADANCAAGAP